MRGPKALEMAFPKPGLRIFSPLKLLWQWHLGKSRYQHPKNSWRRCSGQGSMLVTDDYCIYLNLTGWESLAPPIMKGFESLVYIAKESHLWTQIIEFPNGTLRAESSMIFCHFLYNLFLIQKDLEPGDGLGRLPRKPKNIEWSMGWWSGTSSKGRSEDSSSHSGGGLVGTRECWKEAYPQIAEGLGTERESTLTKAFP